MGNNGRRREYERRPVSISLCAPAVRMVVVRVWHCIESDGAELSKHEIIPVVAIRSQVNRIWSKIYDEETYEDRSGTGKDLRKRGWSMYQSSSDDCLIVENGCLCAADECHSDTFAYEVCCCDWPASEDEERLKGKVALLMERLAKESRQP